MSSELNQQAKSSGNTDESPSNGVTDKTTRIGFGASALAFFSASCCVLPILFMTAGLGGSWMSIFGLMFSYSGVLFCFGILMVSLSWYGYRTQNSDLRRKSFPLLCVSTGFVVLAALLIVFQEPVTEVFFDFRMWVNEGS